VSNQKDPKTAVNRIREIDLTVSPRSMLFGYTPHPVPNEPLLVVTPEYSTWLERHESFPGQYVKYATPVAFGEGGDKWFVVAVADCFDPPVAIVRATDEYTAEEYFIDELMWAHVDETDLKDYDEDSLRYNSSGIPCDVSQVNIHRVYLRYMEM